MIMDSPTIKRYRILTRRKTLTNNVTNVSLPTQEERTGKIKGSYFIMTNSGTQERTGWIMMIDGLKVGCSKTGDYSPYWITDLKTGLMIGEVKTLNRVPAAVIPVMDKIRAIHSNIFDKRTQQAIKAIKRAYKAQETALQAI